MFDVTKLKAFADKLNFAKMIISLFGVVVNGIEIEKYVGYHHFSEL